MVKSTATRCCATDELGPAAASTAQVREYFAPTPTGTRAESSTAGSNGVKVLDSGRAWMTRCRVFTDEACDTPAG